MIAVCERFGGARNTGSLSQLVSPFKDNRSIIRIKREDGLTLNGPATSRGTLIFI